MTEFTASNGIRVRMDGEDLCIRDTNYIGRNSPELASALREFFRAEEDSRLDRWRWPENPEWLVKYIGDHTVVVVNEKNFWVHVGRQGEFNHFHFRDARNHGDNLSDKAAAYKRAAWAFFDAHPELCPKPWHDAQPNEAWVLTVDGEEYPWGVGTGLDAGRFVYLGGLSNLPINHPSITAGRRIWPEVSE
jgi:hypothetical protein